MDGIDLVFEPAALDYIVDKAIEFKLGARGLRSLAETVMMDIMYDVPSADTKADGSNLFTVTKDLAQQKIEKATNLHTI